MTIGTEHCIHTNTTEDMYILRTDGCPHDARFKDGATQKQERKKKRKKRPLFILAFMSVNLVCLSGTMTTDLISDVKIFGLNEW